MTGPAGSRRHPIRLLTPLLVLCGFVAPGWLLYDVFGHRLVAAAYDQTLPVDWMNDLIGRRAAHPLSYYLAAADAGTRGLLLVLSGAVLLHTVQAEIARRRPAFPWVSPAWRFLGLATLLLWLVLIFEVPLLQLLPYWFWSQHRTELPWAWLILPTLIAATLAAARLVLNEPHRWRRNLLLLMGVGYALQLGFGLMEGRGMTAIADRLVDSAGHGALARSALTQSSVAGVVGSYRDMLATGQLDFFPHATRPPGPLAFFMVLGAFSGTDSAPPTAAIRPLAAAAAWILPLLACTVLAPLFGVCRRIYGLSPSAWVPVLLYLVVPSICLMNLHLDQCLFPLLAWMCIYAALRAVDERSWGWAVLTGVALYVSLFASFGLIGVIPVLGTVVLLWRGQASESRVWLALRIGCGIAGGWAIAHAAVYVVLGYDAVGQLVLGLDAHQGFKIGQWTPAVTLYLASLNLVEFALWCGPPVAVLAIGGSAWRIAALRRTSGSADAVDDRERHGMGDEERAARGSGVFIVALLLALLTLSLFGQTAAESGRLWIFLVPLVLLAVSEQLRHSLAGTARRRGPGLVVVLQLVTVFLLKRHQDFF